MTAVALPHSAGMSGNLETLQSFGRRNRQGAAQRAASVLKEMLQKDETEARTLVRPVKLEGKGCKMSESDLSCLSWNSKQRERR